MGAGASLKNTRRDCPWEAFLQAQFFVLSVVMQLNQEIMVVAVDDDHNDLEMLRRAIRPLEGIDLVGFDNLESAIRFFRQGECDLFLLDYYLPTYDGIESIVKLQKEVGTQVPIIIVTGRDDAEVYKEVISAGAQDCISKSDLSSNQLFRVIRNAKERQKLQEQLRTSARTDYVTGLPNRCGMVEEINRRLRSENPFSLLVMDLDNFKLINDGYGHDVGDELLVRFADVLADSIGPSDHLSRFGGDEFILLLDDERTEQQLDDFVQSILSRLKDGIEIDGTIHFTSTSIGVASSKGFLGDSTTLLRDADTAMFQAKSNGKATYAKFDQSMKNATLERIDLERGIRQAIHNDELELHYQPIFDLDTYKVLGCEALLRWRRASGYVSPEKLIAVAEHTGSIHEIGTWVFKTAVRQAMEWLQIEPDLNIHVNVSPTQLLRDDFVSLLQRTVSELEIPFQQVVLEITESKELEDRSNAIDQLQRLKTIGFRVSLDDFGTGYSSLGHLHQLPIDEVKIDKSFIAGLDDSSPVESAEYCTAFVSAINALSATIGLSVIAEGIETETQIELLRNTGYQQGQGFLFSKPMNADQTRSFLIGAQQRTQSTSENLTLAGQPVI